MCLCATAQEEMGGARVCNSPSLSRRQVTKPASGKGEAGSPFPSLLSSLLLVCSGLQHKDRGDGQRVHSQQALA